MTNIWGIVVSYLYIFLVIIGAKMFEKLGKEASRKFIHIMLGNWWIIAIFFFNNVIWAAFVPATFVIINYISYKKNIISVMEREDNEEEGLGTVYYAISLLILSIVTFGVINKPEMGIVPVFVMAYADGFAAVFGQKIKSKPIKIGENTKSLAGCITMFIVTFIITSAFLRYTGVPLWPVYAIVMSLFATIIELFSVKGLDNLTVPMAMYIMLAVM
ncbi:MAG: hypothetical protein IKF17_04295 [Clostridia bacterium]|nr:hypothetical protein [Clostridia bacterium]